MIENRLVSLRLSSNQIATIDGIIFRTISVLKQQAESIFNKGDIQRSVCLANEADDLAEIHRRLNAVVWQNPDCLHN